jgi:hypothetical protein
MPGGRGRPVAGGQPGAPEAAVTVLQAELTDCGVTSSWIRAVDEGTAMLVAGKQIVLCCDGCFWWATGRFGRAGLSRLSTPPVTRSAPRGALPAARPEIQAAGPRGPGDLVRVHGQGRNWRMTWLPDREECSRMTETSRTPSPGVSLSQRGRSVRPGSTPRRRSVRVPRPPADLPGYDLKPDPLAAGSSASALIQGLRDYRIWAGEVSFRAIAARSGQRASASAISAALGDAALGRGELPRLRVVTAVIEGCGGDEEDQAAWTTAWRLLQLTRPSQAGPPPRAVPG